jgi:hypothetical protein
VLELEVTANDSSTLARKGLSARPTTTNGGVVVSDGIGIEMVGLDGETLMLCKIVAMG